MKGKDSIGGSRNQYCELINEVQVLRFAIKRVATNCNEFRGIAIP